MTSLLSMKTRLKTLSFETSLRGFSILEVMVVVSITSLILAVTIPNYIRMRKRAQASDILAELRMLDGALTVYAAENSVERGTDVSFDQLRPFMKAGTRVVTTGPDVLGGAYTVFHVDIHPSVHPDTFAALSDVAPREYWEPFIE
jgi:prepilin-type N-terminal cleavage/methylation domain-containing protein